MKQLVGSVAQKVSRFAQADDWSRSGISWEGFKPFHDVPSHEYLAERMKIDENEYAVCSCGSTDLEIGTVVVKST
ncbi:MAG: hypothetical protein M1492_01775 [Gammaproteobacteria bacterium]|nr:hypothetical protein [Gammaproteobacteria bacterium]